MPGGVPRDRSFPKVESIDPRRDQRILGEATRKERAFQWQADEKTKALGLSKAVTKEHVHQIARLRTKLEGMSGDYLWATAPEEGSASPSSVVPLRMPSKTSAMAELACGVQEFMRPPVKRTQKRVAAPLQTLSVYPWQHGITDPVFVPNDALEKFMRGDNVLKLDRDLPAPEPLQRMPAEISGPHAASVDAWRRSEVALSQWEPSDRGATMCEANKLVEELAGMRSKLMLDKLLKSTEKASKGQPFWFKRSEDMDTPAEQIGKNWAYKSPLRELGL